MARRVMMLLAIASLGVLPRLCGLRWQRQERRHDGDDGATTTETTTEATTDATDTTPTERPTIDGHDRDD